jgi:N-acetyl-anhydromuramyl-L-alanine amidase AmpD
MVSKNGMVTQCVNIRDTAWANGTSGNSNVTDNRSNAHSPLATIRERNINANAISISIGFEGRFHETGGALTPQQFNAAIELYAHIRNEVKNIWGAIIPIDRNHIVGHHEITPRTRPNCPGPRFPFDKIIENLLREEYENMKRYQSLAEVEKDHSWAVKELQALIDNGVLQGNEGGGKGLDLTIDMIRSIITSARMVNQKIGRG